MHTSNARSAAVAVALVASIVVGTDASAATLNPDTADAGAHTNGGVNQLGDWGVRAGEFFGPSQSLVVPFQLPTLNPGEAFTSASLSFMLHERIGVASITYNLDLYGLGRRSAATVLGSDAFNGGLDAGAALIADDFMTTGTPTRTVLTTGGAALLAYLNGQYAGGAGAGQYVFFRLSPDSAVTNDNNAYNVLTANAGGSDERPVLNYTAGVVPEPATLAVSALVGLVAARRR